MTSIPSNAIPLHVTSRAIFRSCHRRYRYSHIDRIATESIVKENRLAALPFGSAGHAIMSAYYESMKKGVRFRNWEIVFDSFLKENYNVVASEEDRELMRGLIEGYFKFSESDNWEILEVEKTFEYPINDKFFLRMTIDLLIRDESDRIYIVDHKFKSRNTDDTLVELDDQITSYISVLRALGIPVYGFIYNTIKKKLPTKPRLLARGRVSQDKSMDTTYDLYLSTLLENNLDIEPYAEMLDFLLLKENMSAEHHSRSNGFFQRQLATRNKSESEAFFKHLVMEVEDIDRPYEKFYPNPGYNCSWCEFSMICKLESEGADTSNLIGSLYRKKENNER